MAPRFPTFGIPCAGVRLANGVPCRPAEVRRDLPGQGRGKSPGTAWEIEFARCSWFQDTELCRQSTTGSRQKLGRTRRQNSSHRPLQHGIRGRIEDAGRRWDPGRTPTSLALLFWRPTGATKPEVPRDGWQRSVRRRAHHRRCRVKFRHPKARAASGIGRPVLDRRCGPHRPSWHTW
jgi:hypothetical protein